MEPTNFILFLLILVSCETDLLTEGHLQSKVDTQSLNSIMFLLTVNATFVEPHGCIATVKTPWIRAGAKRNESGNIFVGGCDNGPMTFNVKTKEDDTSAVNVDITFYSSVIEDASPPTCSIEFNGGYLTPTAKNPEMSLLPQCITGDSREGYHMTYYWFKIYDWNFG